MHVLVENTNVPELLTAEIVYLARNIQSRPADLQYVRLMVRHIGLNVSLLEEWADGTRRIAYATEREENEEAQSCTSD